MFNLPNNCLVNKIIPKKIFYDKTSMSLNLKREFIDLIDKIIWMYKISPETYQIHKTDKIEELQIFEIILKKREKPKKVISLISKLIPYPILFIIKYQNDFCYSIKVQEIYYSDWNEYIDFNFMFSNLELLYEDIVKKIIKEDNNTKPFQDIIDLNSRKRELEYQIVQTQAKMNSEKQFNRKVEYNKELRKLLGEREKIKNE